MLSPPRHLGQQGSGEGKGFRHSLADLTYSVYIMVVVSNSTNHRVCVWREGGYNTVQPPCGVSWVILMHMLPAYQLVTEI